MSAFASQVPCKTPTEVINGVVSFDGKLSAGKVLTGTPTATDATGDLTLSNLAVSTVALDVNGETIAVGRAVTFTYAGGSEGTLYRIDVTGVDDETNPQTLVVFARLQVAPADWETNTLARLTLIRDQMDIILVDLTSRAKPTYSIEGGTVDWTGYMKSLIENRNAINAEIEREAGEQNYEFVSVDHLETHGIFTR